MPRNNQAIADNTLKATALLYLVEAIEQERYENCAELVQAAQELGAEQGEISQVIAAYVAKLKTRRQNEANRLNFGRRRWY